MICVSPDMIKEIDNYASEKLGIEKITLMQNAGTTVYKLISQTKTDGGIIILCGNGNNGGDGYSAAVLLLRNNFSVTCVDMTGKPPKSKECARFRDEWKACGGTTVPYDEKSFSSLLDNAGVVIDAVFGAGFSGTLDEKISAAFETANSKKLLRVAVDIPSGVNAEFGSVCAGAFNAHITLTLTLPKIGLYSYPARQYCGKIICDDIGIPIDKIKNKFSLRDEIIDMDFVSENLPPRIQNSNKGSYGKALNFCGSDNMPGAAALSLLGALRCGAGLVTLCSTDKVIMSLSATIFEPKYIRRVENLHDEATNEAINEATAILYGCGCGTNDFDLRVLSKIIQSEGCPIIIDADGLNAMGSNPFLLNRAKRDVLITPHPGELSRLTGIDISEINADRIRCAREFAFRHNVAVLLKGAGTVIACKDGTTYVNTSGNSALSKGGSGDVLAGMTVSLAAQGMPLEKAAACAAYLHGLAAERLSETSSQYGVLPSEIPAAAAKIIAEIQSKKL